MAASCSPLQKEAACQAQRLEQMIREYQSALPLLERGSGLPGLCRAEAWDLSYQTIDGEFDLDEGLARTLVTRTQSNVPSGGIGFWMQHYLLGGPDGNSPPGDHFASATVGPGNVLGNANAFRGAANAAVRDSVDKAIQSARQAILSGEASAIKINANMTLYNANKSGKRLPRPRLRITGLRVQVVAPAFGEELRMLKTGGMTVAMRKAALENAKKLGALAAGAHWTGKAAFLSGKVGGGVLTFAPSAAIDIYNSVNRDLAGNIRWDHRRFLIDSAKSQSGNAIGAVFGTVVGGIAIAAGVSAAPVILIGLGASIIVQMVWGSSGMSDKMGTMAEQVLGK